jgi:ferredoxin-NADP reductase
VFVRVETDTGLTGYVQHHLPKYLTDPTGVNVYICGLGQMVADVQQTLLGMGMPKEQVHFERYD